MKILGFIVFVIAVKISVANDTLTRAQVFNFSIGDTFGYLIEGTWEIGPNQGTSLDYERHVVSDIYFSTNSDTLFIVWIKDHPLPAMSYTKVVTNLSSKVYTLMPFSEPFANFLIDTSSLYNGRMLNSFVLANQFEHSYEYKFCEGLGAVFSRYCWWEPSAGLSGCTDTTLVHYSKGNESWNHACMPGCALFNGVDDFMNKPLIEVYPTYNHGQFNVVLDNIYEAQLKLFDVTGSIINEYTVNKGSNAVQVNSGEKGLCIWIIEIDGKPLSSGKIIIH